MNIAEIVREWQKDVVIDENKLDTASINLAELHFKYYKLLMGARHACKKHEAALKDIDYNLSEYYQRRGDEQWMEVHGVQEFHGNPVTVMSARNDMIAKHPLYVKKTLEGSTLNERVELLEQILAVINRRQWDIRNAIEAKKYYAGQ